MNFFSTDNNFLGISEEHLYNYNQSKIVIQSIPYEHTSSYIKGSSNGPQAIIDASAFVELYDDETDTEAYKDLGICTLHPMSFENIFDAEAVNLIQNETTKHINNNKYIISLGAEHTVTLGLVKAFKQKYNNFAVVQIDAHSDLRMAYQNNPYSHASVMARVHELDVPLYQVGIRAQCKEESELIKSSENIKTYYDYIISKNINWIDDCIYHLPENVYLTIDTDGFNPNIMPAVGTAEPGGLDWHTGLIFFKKLFTQKNVIGFDVVECAPIENEILTQYNLAKLVYKLISYKHKYNKF